jgi:hypothetical protein
MERGNDPVQDARELCAVCGKGFDPRTALGSVVHADGSWVCSEACYRAWHAPPDHLGVEQG